MTSASSPGTDRGPVVALLVLTAFLLLPLLYGLYYVSQDTLACFSRPAGCRGNRAAVTSVVHAGLALVGGPACGAAVLGLTGALLRRRAGLWAAAGAVLGTLVMWAVTLHALAEGFQHSDIDF
ncbi:hypothetical protein A6P39_021085 [Streptomyces sp. FXJ1.172]|uniref:hypothetical protein n=1 Tax=Streptomyces sp. FXJ1.172 TaxID=710705 RepID=UPI001331ACED|nr:hypothetical protein [Streptomyces sp. FXJ1.172]WEO96323.1 hypothetical protein A6P39_021085 [Streptomyces sp. FXJ1.172]